MRIICSMAMLVALAMPSLMANSSATTISIAAGSSGIKIWYLVGPWVVILSILEIAGQLELP